MKRLYLHIGYNKTGTTALQTFFRQNRVKLIGKGVLYPSYGTHDIAAHHRLAAHFCRIPPAHFVEDRDIDDVISEVMNEMAASGVENMLISTEMMVFEADYYADRVKKFLDGFDEVRLIAYLRRQDDYAHSYYNSAIRNGRCATNFDEFISGINLNYYDNLSAWEKLFGTGSVIARPYDFKRFKDSNIHADFLSLLGLQLDADLILSVERPNEALSKPMIYLLREFNRYGIGDHKKFQTYLQEFLEEIDSLADAPEYFSRDARLAMLERYRESNQLVAAKYSNGEPLFSDEVREDIGAVGSYDDEVRELMAQLVVRDWNASTAVNSIQRDQPGIISRVLTKLRTIFGN